MDTSLSYPYALVKHLIPKWLLFPVIISSSLLERLLTRFRSVFWGICVHSFIRAFLMFGAHAAFQFIVKVFSSVMLTSGLCGGQLWFSTPTFANYIWMELTFWTGALSFWNKFGPFLSSEMKSSCYCTERTVSVCLDSCVLPTLWQLWRFGISVAISQSPFASLWCQSQRQLLFLMNLIFQW